jgi:iron complex transport system substrate-binding protein
MRLAPGGPWQAPRLPLDAATGVTPAEVDRLVSERLDGGSPIYRLDHEAIRELRPDVVITQDLCAVCAVPSGHVHQALDLLGSPAEVVSLDPSSLDEVLDCVLQVGLVSGTDREAEAYVQRLRDRLDRVKRAVTGLDRPRCLPSNGGIRRSMAVTGSPG